MAVVVQGPPPVIANRMDAPTCASGGLHRSLWTKSLEQPMNVTTEIRDTNEIKVVDLVQIVTTRVNISVFSRGSANKAAMALPTLAAFKGCPTAGIQVSKFVKR